jgi:UDP-N-acetylglucosamine--N-acetylmuramyl-(pentapeptide) pyrophosphoryl-undecaprenol N-acetylglucosamine transferase
MLHVMKHCHDDSRVQILMGCGRRDYEEIVAELKQAGIDGSGGNIRLLPYIDRMDLAYAAADLYVGRSGAATLAEIAVRGLPAVLAPYPHASADHQTYNAKSLAARGGAFLLPDVSLTGPVLLDTLRDLIKNEEKRLRMAEGCGRLARPEALADILDVLAEIDS